MSWHGYIHISELPPGWTNEQREAAWESMRGIGRQTGDNPATINHSRLSLDGRQMIVEAEFQESEITREGVVNTIAQALSVNPTAVDAIIEYQIFADGQSWDTSRLSALAYIHANMNNWDEVQ